MQYQRNERVQTPKGPGFVLSTDSDGRVVVLVQATQRTNRFRPVQIKRIDK